MKNTLDFLACFFMISYFLQLIELLLHFLLELESFDCFAVQAVAAEDFEDLLLYLFFLFPLV